MKGKGKTFLNSSNGGHRQSPDAHSSFAAQSLPQKKRGKVFEGTGREKIRIEISGARSFVVLLPAKSRPFVWFYIQYVRIGKGQFRRDGTKKQNIHSLQYAGQTTLESNNKNQLK